METAELIALGVIWFLGLTLGWSFRNGLFWGVVCGALMSPIIFYIMKINMLSLTLSFVVGVLIHTWKPIYNKVKEL